MSELLYEIISATNYDIGCAHIFHRQSRSTVGWRSTQFAVPPIQVLFKLQQPSFLTQILIQSYEQQQIGKVQLQISNDSCHYTPVLEIPAVSHVGCRIKVQKDCTYIKLIVKEKSATKPASIGTVIVYGHAQQNIAISPSFGRQKLELYLMSMGLQLQINDDVDEDTLITLNDLVTTRMKAIQARDNEFIQKVSPDIKTVYKIGSQIRKLQGDLAWERAKNNFEAIKDLNDKVCALQKRRDYYDQKYETSRFDDMIALNDDEEDSHLGDAMKSLLIGDQRELQAHRANMLKQAQERAALVQSNFKSMEDQWWDEPNALDEVIQNRLEPEQPRPISPVIRPQTVRPVPQERLLDKFHNPYVYNQGDADMQEYIKPLLNEFGQGFLSDPQLLKKYEQMDYLDVLGARIWVAAHSDNWRQRAAAVEAVLGFASNPLPSRYSEGKTRNLFLALMQFARINAEDRVLQIYYISLKIMTVALAPPICGNDIPPNIINKNIQKFMHILIEKISEMNNRAKEVSLMTLVAIFQHPAADMGIVFSECLRICKQEINVKFIPIDKQNPRIVSSRLDIIVHVLASLKNAAKHINVQEVTQLLVGPALHHNQNDVRVQAAETLEILYRIAPTPVLKWLSSAVGLRPKFLAEVKSRLNIS